MNKKEEYEEMKGKKIIWKVLLWINVVLLIPLVLYVLLADFSGSISFGAHNTVWDIILEYLLSRFYSILICAIPLSIVISMILISKDKLKDKKSHEVRKWKGINPPK